MFEKQFWQKVIPVFNSAHFISFLLGILGAILMLSINAAFMHTPKQTCTVNITYLIDQFVKNEANKDLSKDLLAQEVKNYAHALDQKLKIFASKHDLILLPKEAIISGAPDYTGLFLHEFNIN